MNQPLPPTLDLACGPVPAQQNASGVLRIAIGAASATIAAALAAGLAYWLSDLTLLYIHSHGGGCGFDRARVGQAMTYPVPLILILQLICVAITCYCKVGLAVARSAAAIAIIYYVACHLIMANLHSLLLLMNAP